MMVLRAEPKARRAHREMQWKQPPTLKGTSGLTDNPGTPGGDA
jgi:hypothetical protein